MARISFAAHPFLLGFEQIDRILEKTIKSSNDSWHLIPVNNSRIVGGFT